MDTGILIKYSASAGSGKTTELTRKYISGLFRSKNGYRKILAVTFTNKAAAEMKFRILEQLWLMSSGNLDAETERVSSSTKKKPEEVKLQAKKILENILHDYSRFYVGTIDSFFQKVLKAFAKESGLQSGYEIELDHSVILSTAVDNMLAGLGNDKVLLGWIADFAEARVEEGKSWNIRKEIIDLAEELFREQYKLLSETEKEKLRNRSLLDDYKRQLKTLRSEFFNHLHSEGVKIKRLLDNHGITDQMFYQGKKGLPSFFRKIFTSQFDTSLPLNSYVNKILEDSPRWSTSPVPEPVLAAAMKEGLDDLLIQSVRYYNQNYININTADAILSNIYSLGILTDILEHVHEITTAGNKFLLSDAGELLYLIIGKDQTPFIYEKIGNSFEHYMIDEFQDTSAIQWNNFKPLIDNSLGGGFENLVVGDVKQSIYRWRNSDWRIFDNILDRDIGGRLKIEKLDTNYRSRENIIAFNNTLFSLIPGYLDNQMENEVIRLSELYTDSRQKSGGKKEGGYVNFEFIEESEEEKFKEIVLQRLPLMIENLQDKGYKGSDIGILVRRKNEGAQILNYMLNYRLSAGPEKLLKYNYDVISNESLILDQNPVVCFIVSLLTWMNDPSDTISRALTFRNYQLAAGRSVSGAEKLLIDYNESDLEKFFPENYKGFNEEVQHLSLFESVEKIIDFFSLGSYSGNTAYLNAFQDCIVQFSGSNPPDTAAFLEWWSTAGSKKSIVLSEQQDSIRVMTIHKSKGLQFRVVILPFLTWQLSHEKNPTIWIKPEKAPFNKLSLVPVKYRKSLVNSHFEDQYNAEKISSVVDNLNLVYVAFTRAVDSLTGFCPGKSVNRPMTVSAALKQAFRSEIMINDSKPSLDLRKHFNETAGVFLCGEIPFRSEELKNTSVNAIPLPGYKVTSSLNKIRLKFHGENFLVTLPDNQTVRLDYGRIMHEVFSFINTSDDINDAVTKMVLEGKIPESGREELVKRIAELLTTSDVRRWFEAGSDIIREVDILLPSGSTKRPDRIILQGEQAVIVDFKFGTEKQSYKNQVGDYRKLMLEMGYKKVEAYLWYVDINKIITV